MALPLSLLSTLEYGARYNCFQARVLGNIETTPSSLPGVYIIDVSHGKCRQRVTVSDTCVSGSRHSLCC